MDEYEPKLLGTATVFDYLVYKFIMMCISSLFARDCYNISVFNGWITLLYQTADVVFICITQPRLTRLMVGSTRLSCCIMT